MRPEPEPVGAKGRATHLRRAEASLGYSPVMSADNAVLRELSVGRLRLDSKKGGFKGETGNRETLLHILVGTCSIEAHGPWGRRTFENLGEREDVFSGRPTSLLLGPDTTYGVVSATRTTDIAVASLPLAAEAPAPPSVIRPQDVPVHKIGEGHFQRSVREVLGGEGPALRLRAGETINPPGLWSSWPHHDFHGRPELAPKFEEVFLYFTKPRAGWGLQRRTGVYCDGTAVDDVLVVRNGDAAIMPLGDHPVVAGVDSSLLYIWFYVSPIPKIYAKWAEDVGGYA